MPPVSTPRHSSPATTPPPPASPASAKPAATVKVTPVAVTLEVPMVHVVGHGGQRPYCQNRIDVSLSGEETEALRDLFDGLVASNVFGTRKPSQGDAVRWLLRKMRDEFKKAKA